MKGKRKKACSCSGTETYSKRRGSKKKGYWTQYIKYPRMACDSRSYFADRTGYCCEQNDRCQWVQASGFKITSGPNKGQVSANQPYVCTKKPKPKKPATTAAPTTTTAGPTTTAAGPSMIGSGPRTIASLRRRWRSFDPGWLVLQRKSRVQTV